MPEGVKSRLDYQQIIQEVYNSTDDALQTLDARIDSVYDADENALRTLKVGSLVPEEYDEIDLTYVTAGNGLGEIETVQYSKDGAAFALLTLSYDSSNNLINVIRTELP
jgi:hypothetical protein